LFQNYEIILMCKCSFSYIKCHIFASGPSFSWSW